MKKIKLIILGIFFVLGIVFISPMNASATDVWAVVSIDRIGQVEGISAGHFTHIHNNPQFTNKYFAFAESGKREMLATALTAVSLGKNVTIRIKGGTTIDVMWLRNE